MVTSRPRPVITACVAHQHMGLQLAGQPGPPYAISRRKCARQRRACMSDRGKFRQGCFANYRPQLDVPSV